MTGENGHSSSNIAKTAYNYEVGANKVSTTYSAKIGLMYASDYYYAATPKYWSYQGFNNSSSTSDYRAAVNDNWMYMGEVEWSISRYSDNTDFVFYVNYSGNVVANNGYIGMIGVRPTFYLKSDVTTTGGTGTESDPYRLAD